MVKNYQHAAMASSAACFASGLVVIKVVLRGANPKNRLNFWIRADFVLILLSEDKTKAYMYIKRKLAETVTKLLFRQKAIIILGARQVGKSTLMKHVMDGLDLPILDLNCDEVEICAMS